MPVCGERHEGDQSMLYYGRVKGPRWWWLLVIRGGEVGARRGVEELSDGWLSERSDPDREASNSATPVVSALPCLLRAAEALRGVVGGDVGGRGGDCG